jgi:hypothetical protein
MARPPEDRSSFPTHLAERLEAELLAAAGKLEEAVTARSQAKDGIPEFQCTAANEYREALGGHAGQVTDVVERFRRTAGELRDAIEAHEHDTLMGTPAP